MTTLEDVTKKRAEPPSAEAAAAAELVRLAKEQGLSLTGPDGLLKQFTKSVLETALNEEMFPEDFVQGRPLLAPRARQKPSPAGTGIDEYSQRDSVEDGVDRGGRACSDRGPPRSGRDVRTADRP
ncbi:hypothetical protein [Rhodococcus sp. WS3]|uniref:hypothetical protein n=1 Tax=Rhodococcus sp. WS3 TaxID=2486271 RepID=UPI003967AC23